MIKAGFVVSGIGVDIASIKRIAQSLQRFGERFTERILHPDEREDYRASRSPATFLAKRFAVKEAAAKALGTGIREAVSLHDFITEHDTLGKPLLRLCGEAERRCRDNNITRTHLSLSDEGDQIIAFVVFESTSG